MNEDLLDRLIRARLEQLVKQRVAQGPGESRASVYPPQDPKAQPDQKPYAVGPLPRYHPAQPPTAPRYEDVPRRDPQVRMGPPPVILPSRIVEQRPPGPPPRRTQDDEEDDLAL